jgi:SAM-dependent methyltransferase
MNHSPPLTRRLLGFVKELVDSYNQTTSHLHYGQVARDLWIRSMAATLPATARVLDVGAGEGRYKADFSHCEYKAQDFAQYDSSNSGIDADSWTYGEIDYVCDITDIPVAAGSFDVVICTEVLEHVIEPIRAIKEMARVLVPGGSLYLSAPMRSGVHQAPHHYYGGFTPYFYQEILPRYGLSVDSTTAPGGLFRAFQEEGQRVAAECLATRATHRDRDRDDILSHLINFVLLILFPYVFTKLDDQQKLDRFAAGWHVEATKQIE